MEQNANPVPSDAGTTNVRLRQVTLCADGKYRWISELDMFRNPTILFLLFKVFGSIILGIGAFITLIGLFEGGGINALKSGVQIVLIISAIFFFLTLAGYLIVAAMYGGKYVVVFEMDDKGILHRQLQKQVKKGQVVGWISALAALVAGKPTAAGSGLLSATKTSSYSTFSAVRRVKAYPRRHLIKVNEPFCKNQIYVDDDFEFVYTYICSHCPKAKCS